ncbi:MAG: dTDP-glucose 4,6-dehydratase [Thermodesulfobacteriota bacterium]
MNLLVTGGCGFIGSNFIRYMFEKYPELRIFNLDKLTYAGNPANLVDIENDFGTRYSFIQGDIADNALIPRILSKHEIHAVVNFAAESHVDRSIDSPDQFIRTNINGTFNLLEAARKHNIRRFVHISTDEVYGSLGSAGLFTESSPLAPNSPYSASKASADLLARSYYKTFDFPVIITRCSNNYGPYQFPEKLIPLAFIKAAQGLPVPVYGQGENIRDWIHVRDHCRGVAMALTNGTPGKVYNFGGNAEKKNIDVVRRILEYTGKNHELITYVNDRPGHDLRYAIDYGRARRELNWEPLTSFDQGIKDTLEWYADNQKWVDDVQSGAYRDFMNRWYKERC